MRKLLLISVIMLSLVACKNEVNGVRFHLGFGKPKTERVNSKMQKDVDKFIEAGKEGIISYGTFAKVVDDKYKGDKYLEFMDLLEKTAKERYNKGEDLGIFNLMIEAGVW